MAEKGLLKEWLTRRRRNRSIELAYKQMKSSVETIVELRRCLTAIMDGDFTEAEKSIGRLFLMEVDVDELRRKVLIGLAKEEPSKFREDFAHLVQGLDVMADHVKDSARSLLVLLRGRKIVPKEVWVSYLNLVDNIVLCTRALLRAIEELTGKSEEVMRYVVEVDRLENVIDEQYVSIMEMLVGSEEFKPGVLMTLKSLLEFLEKAADTCAETADYIRVLLG
jgi:predicted phosphate transport protein (TIGR00153 family)